MFIFIILADVDYSVFDLSDPALALRQENQQDGQEGMEPMDPVELISKLEYGLEHAITSFVAETQLCMKNENPKGCEVGMAKAVCTRIVENSPDHDLVGGNPCICFDENKRYMF